MLPIFFHNYDHIIDGAVLTFWLQSHLKETEAGFGKAPVPVSDADEE